MNIVNVKMNFKNVSESKNRVVNELVKKFNKTFLNFPKSDNGECAAKSALSESRTNSENDLDCFVQPSDICKDELRKNKSCTDFNYEKEFEETLSRSSIETNNLNSNQYKELQRSIENLDERDRDEFNSIEDQLDRRSLNSLKGATFPEAYNQLGNELCITTIGSVEHLEVTQPLDLHETDANTNLYFEEYFISNSLPAGQSSFSSNRSTIYSDEGIECDVDTLPREMKKPMKTETVYDQYQNPVIEIVRKLSNSDLNEQTHSVESAQFNKNKQDYIIEELIETERNYIQNLKRVGEDYIPYLQNEEHIPSNLIEKSHLLFGNIMDIYKESLKFCEALQQCEKDPEEIAQCFVQFEKLFALYPLYTKQKLVADSYLLNEFKEIVQERDIQLKERLGLSSYLLTPIQRLGKYILFLNQLQKEKTNSKSSSNVIKAAIEIVETHMSRGNDLVAIESILECSIDLMEKGSLILRSNFTMFKPKKYETTLFLFEEVLVFTVLENKNPERFMYKDHINLNEMGILYFEEQELIFYIKRFSPYKQGEYDEIGLEAKSTKDKKIWTAEIEKRLWEQLKRCKEEQKKQSRRKRNSLDLDSNQQVRRKKSHGKSKSSDMKKSTFYL